MPSVPIMDQQAEDAPQETPEEDVANLAFVAELEDDVANEFSLDRELTMDLQVILELYQDTICEV